jgi:hypothetical protein
MLESKIEDIKEIMGNLILGIKIKTKIQFWIVVYLMYDLLVVNTYFGKKRGPFNYI